MANALFFYLGMKIILVLILLMQGWKGQSILASDLDDSPLKQLLLLSSANLNDNTTISKDSIITLCSYIETQARAEKDYDILFQVDQITVNAYCQKGDIALAIDKASQMYDEVKHLNNNLSTGLALQALGNTYMYTNRYKEADKAFTEAENKLQFTRYPIVKINLLIQHICVCKQLELPQRMEEYLQEISTLIPEVKAIPTDNYTFYLLYYQLFADILNNDPAQADLHFQQLSQLPSIRKDFKHLYYKVSSYYFLLKGDFKKALAFSDSVLTDILQNKNLNGFSNCMINKASILEKMGKYKEAYQLYGKVDVLNDSLDRIRYSSQIDTLHVNYWVDQLQLETEARYSRLLTWITLLSLLALITIITVVIILKRKNNQLKTSREYLAHESDRAAASIQSKSLFLSNMGHEIRTPLNGIVGFSQLLATSEDMDDETKHQCEENIRQNSDLLLKLINDVMDLSNLEEKEMAFTFGMHDVVGICQNTLQTVNAVKRTEAELSFTCLCEHLELYTDRERLQQVLINLLINATKFTLQGSIRLFLDISKEQNEAIFIVEDTGCGIPIEKQATIFNRFEKLHENINGSGLGLSICQLIVERLGGSIRIDASYTEGARFIFTHPLGKLKTKSAS